LFADSPRIEGRRNMILWLGASRPFCNPKNIIPQFIVYQRIGIRFLRHLFDLSWAPPGRLAERRPTREGKPPVVSGILIHRARGRPGAARFSGSFSGTSRSPLAAARDGV
jgi:hypothetical protein